MFSAEPHELATLVSSLREAHAALGSVRFGPSEREVPSRRFRRSLRAQHRISAGDSITAENVRAMRPAGGLPPDELDRIVGITAARTIEPGEPIQWEDLWARDGAQP